MVLGFIIMLPIGCLILSEHVRQSRLPVGVCNFVGGIFNDSSQTWQNRGGSTTYGSWVVNGTALYQNVTLEVIGMYPAPRQRLNLAYKSTATDLQNSLSHYPSSCSLEMDPQSPPDKAWVYTAYVEIIPATAGAIIIAFDGIFFLCVLCMLCFGPDCDGCTVQRWQVQSPINFA